MVCVYAKIVYYPIPIINGPTLSTNKVDGQQKKRVCFASSIISSTRSPLQHEIFNGHEI